MLALLLLAASAAAQVVQFNTPDPGDNITVCGQLSVTWGFDLGSLDGDTLFNLILAPADSTPVPTTSFDDLTTIAPSLSDSGGSPGRRDDLWRRDGAVLTIVSPSLLIVQSSYTIAKVDAPAGTYVLDGSVDGNPDVEFVPSASFVVTDSDDESCVPPPPTPSLTAAANATSASATSTAPPDSGSHGISAGAIAGAAIGGFLAGLGVFIALFLLFCRRRPAPVDAETPMTPLEGKAMRLDSSVPSTARLDSPVPPSPHIPAHQRAELAAALEAAHLPGATKS